MARSSQLDSLARELDALAIQGSVTSPADLHRTVEETLTRYGRIDGVVNNTGHSAKGELLALTDADWEEGMDLLLMNVIRMARAVTPTMLSQGSGALVNISSFSAAEPGLRFPVSAVLRAALTNFTKLFCQRFAGEGLRMNTVLPGWIDSYPVEEADRARIPAARAGSVEEVANVVAFLLSNESSYINGESILVDGGLVRAV
jgi:NAD(P)-dependent dehydrogenase (short-subunit alcohol dehydrogenase family)